MCSQGYYNEEMFLRNFHAWVGGGNDFKREVCIQNTRTKPKERENKKKTFKIVKNTLSTLNEIWKTKQNKTGRKA